MKTCPSLAFDTHAHPMHISHCNRITCVYVMAKYFFSPPKDELSSRTLSFAFQQFVTCDNLGLGLLRNHCGAGPERPTATAHQYCTRIYKWVETPRCHIRPMNYSSPPPNVHFGVYIHRIIIYKSDVWAMQSMWSWHAHFWIPPDGSLSMEMSYLMIDSCTNVIILSKMWNGIQFCTIRWRTARGFLHDYYDYEAQCREYPQC